MKALMTGVPFTAVESALTTAVTGTPFALPFPSKGLPSPSMLVVPTGSVSAFEYDIFASVDGSTYVQIADGLTTQEDFSNMHGYLAYPILRVDQVSRTDGTTQKVVVTLGHF